MSDVHFLVNLKQVDFVIYSKTSLPINLTLTSKENSRVDLSKIVKPVREPNFKCTFNCISAECHSAPMQLLREALQYSVFNFTANVGVEKMPL